MNKLKIIFIIYLLLASVTALAEEDVYYCNMNEGQFISSEENVKEKLDFAFFLKVDEDKKTIEFSENFVSTKFIETEIFTSFFDAFPFFRFPLEIHEPAEVELIEKLKLTSESDSHNEELINVITGTIEYSIFAKDRLTKLMTLHLQKERGKLGITINFADRFALLFANCTGFKN